MTPSTDKPVTAKDNNESTQEKFQKVFKTTTELEIPEEGQVFGSIPEWLTGKYLRIGPGKFDFDNDFTVNNFLDGLAVLCKFEFKGDGRVFFSKRFLRTDAFNKSTDAGKPVLPETHTCSSPDPSKGFFRRMIPSLVPEMSDNVSHHLFHIGSTLLASNETNNLWSVDPESLTVLEKYDTNKLFSLNQVTAHPIQDPKSHDLYLWGCAISASAGGCKYNIVKLNSNISSIIEINNDSRKACENLTNISPWSLKLSSFIHTCALTDNYFILIEQPVFTNLAKVAKSIAFSKNYSCSDWIESKLDQVSNRFYIIDKKTGHNYTLNVPVFSSEPFVFSHMINSYEYQDKIVIDLVAYKTPEIFNQEALNLKSLRENGLYDLKDGGRGVRFMVPKVVLTESEFLSTTENENLVTDSRTTSSSNNIWSSIKVVRNNNTAILTCQPFTEPGVEMPVINHKYTGKRYKYFYGTGGYFKNNFYANSVFKINVESVRKSKLFRNENCVFGEPCFVPSPGSHCNEDAGMLLVAVNNVQDGGNYVLLLDAKKLKQVAKIVFDSHIPPALHGIFIQNEKEINKDE